MPATHTDDSARHQPLSSGALLLIATSVAHAGNFGFQMIMGRLLGKDPTGEFGVMLTMLNIFGLVTIPASAIQLAIARQAAMCADRGEMDAIAALLIRAGRKAVGTGLALFALMLALSPWLKGYLHLDHYTPLLVTASLIGVAVVIPVAAGALQGLKRFGWMSVATIGTPLLRIGVGVLLVWLGWKASGALLGTLAGALAMLAVASLVLYEMLRRKVEFRSLDTSGVYRYLRPTLLATVCYAALVLLDLVMVKHFFPPLVAEQYAAASLFGRAVGWLISPLCTVLFPHVWDEDRHEANRALLLKFLLVALGLGIAAAGVCSVSRTLLTSLLLGRADAEVSALIPLCAWAMLPIGVANLFLNFVMARGRYGFLVVFAAITLLYPVAFEIWHASLRQVLVIVAGFGVVTLALFIAVSYARPTQKSAS
jgi:O-antigen/teichoic acid export membrane protein